MHTVFLMMWLDFYHPFRRVRRNYEESVNEFVVIIVVDLLLFTSDPSLGSVQRKSIGIAIITVMILTILANQGYVIFYTIWRFYRRSKLWCARRKNKKLFQQRKLDQPAKT